MTTVWDDVRLGLRSLALNPGFTAFVGLTLALGIGVTTSMFSVVANVLLRLLRVANPSELIAIGSAATRNAPANPGLSWQRCFEYRQSAAPRFSGLACYNENMPIEISRKDGSKVIADAAVVTGNYFRVLGVRAFHGRLIDPQDDNGKD